MGDRSRASPGRRFAGKPSPTTRPTFWRDLPAPSGGQPERRVPGREPDPPADREPGVAPGQTPAQNEQRPPRTDGAEEPQPRRANRRRHRGVTHEQHTPKRG